MLAQRVRTAGWMLGLAGIALVARFLELASSLGLFVLVLSALFVGGWIELHHAARRHKGLYSAGWLFLAVGNFGACHVFMRGGWALLLSLTGVAMITDTFAYLTGARFKGPLLWKAVSPGKTWAGAWGGWAAGTLVTLGLHKALQWPFSQGWCWILPVVAQAGDLAESALKRRLKIKDFGDVLPGHGGILDRMDSWLFIWATVALALWAAG